MQTSQQETVFHPAMGIGLTDGWLRMISDAPEQVEAPHRDANRANPCQDRQHRGQDCAHIFQCA